MNLRNFPLFPVLAATFLAAVSASAVIVITPVQTMAIGSMEAGEYSDFAFPPDPITPYFTGYDEVPLNGFTKFDPSLGALQEVRVVMEVSGTVELALDAGGEFPTEVFPSEVSAFFSGGSSFFEGGLAYNPTREPGEPLLGVSLGTADFQFPEIGGTGDEAREFDSYEESEGVHYVQFSFYWEEGERGPFGPEAASGMLSKFVIGPTGDPEPNRFYNEVDFEGEGMVSGLRAYAYFDISPSDLLLSGNLSPEETGMGVTVTLDSTTVTLQYVYEDGLAAIPEPRMFTVFLGLSALGFAMRRRR